MLENDAPAVGVTPGAILDTGLNVWTFPKFLGACIDTLGAVVLIVLIWDRPGRFPIKLQPGAFPATADILLWDAWERYLPMGVAALTALVPPGSNVLVRR